MTASLFNPPAPGSILPKVKYEVRMLTSSISILVDTCDDPAVAISRCEAEADRTSVSHSVREVTTRVVHKASRASSDQRAFAESVGALMGEGLAR